VGFAEAGLGLEAVTSASAAAGSCAVALARSGGEGWNKGAGGEWVWPVGGRVGCGARTYTHAQSYEVGEDLCELQ
jgi:hypothetical protein